MDDGLLGPLSTHRHEHCVEDQFLSNVRTDRPASCGSPLARFVVADQRNPLGKRDGAVTCEFVISSAMEPEVPVL
jgi:hypothetical protein